MVGLEGFPVFKISTNSRQVQLTDMELRERQIAIVRPFPPHSGDLMMYYIPELSEDRVSFRALKILKGTGSGRSNKRWLWRQAIIVSVWYGRGYHKAGYSYGVWHDKRSSVKRKAGSWSLYAWWNKRRAIVDELNPNFSFGTHCKRIL